MLSSKAGFVVGGKSPASARQVDEFTDLRPLNLPGNLPGRHVSGSRYPRGNPLAVGPFVTREAPCVSLRLG